MNWKRILRIHVWMVVAVMAAEVIGAEAAQESRPNIILIYADDLGIGDVSTYFDGKIATPNIDQLAEAGIRFADAHVAASWCAPSRFALMTGTFSWRHAKQGYKLHRSGLYTMPTMFRGAGYRTAMFGKWHMGWGMTIAKEGEKKHVWPERVQGMAGDAGFDYSVILPWGHQFPPCAFIKNDVFENYDSADPITAEPVNGTWKMTGGLAAQIPFAEVAPRLQAEVLGFVHQNDPRPFFIYYAVPQVHAPYAPGEAFRGKTEIGDYGDYVVELDCFMGELVADLKKSGQWGNTLLVFTSDNGASIERALPSEVRGVHRVNGPYRDGKGCLYEGGHRIPFIATWPGRIKKESLSDETICTTDLMASFAAVLGVDLPEGAAEDSYNILPALLGKPVEQKNRIYTYESAKKKVAIRKGRWKFIDGPGGGGYDKAPADAPPYQLFDMENDPFETKNVQAQHPEIVSELRSTLNRLRSSL